MAVRIAIDARLAAYQQAGITTYTRNLLSELPALAPDYRFIALRSRKGASLLTGAPNLEEQALWTPPHHRYEQCVLPLETALSRPSLVHSPDFVPSFRRGWRAVVTVHDLAFLRFPQVVTRESERYYGQVARACASAERVIAVSYNTAKDIADLLGAPGDRVRVVHEAAGKDFRPFAASEVAAVRRRHGTPEGYLLFVSTIEPRKNLETLLRSLAALRQRAPIVPPLLVVGRPGWLYQAVFRLVEELGLSGHVRFLGAASTDELVALYNGALALLYPSLYEGFGLPPLEAMACGTPVACADSSSLPEVVGDAGILLPPLDVAAWATAMGRLVEDDSLRAQLRERGLRRAGQFSWRRAAAETLSVYREALGAVA